MFVPIFREFYEFHSRLCTLYPLSKFSSLPKGLTIGRSEVREVMSCRILYISPKIIFFSRWPKNANETLGLFSRDCFASQTRYLTLTLSTLSSIHFTGIRRRPTSILISLKVYFFGKQIPALIFICKQRQEDTREILVLAEFVAGLNCPYPTRKEPCMFWFIISRTLVSQIPRG